MSLIGTLGSGVSALRAFAKGLEVIGNNIANVNTTGFKSSQAEYADSFSNVLQRSSPSNGVNGSNTTATQVGTGVRLAGINSRYTQGELSTTGQTTDLGISGGGFFVVKDAATGTQYVTRAGNFRVDDQGYVVTTQGFRVQGLIGGTSTTGVSNTSSVGDVQIGQAIPSGQELQSYSIDPFGNVVEFFSDGSSATTNRVLLQNFKDPQALVKEGNNLFTGFEAAGPISGSTTLTGAANSAGSGSYGRIQSGTLELSNVDLTEEFSNMITTQRSFQAGSRLVTVSDSVLEDVVNLKRS